jgi:hypothetical protein
MATTRQLAVASAFTAPVSGALMPVTLIRLWAFRRSGVSAFSSFREVYSPRHHCVMGIRSTILCCKNKGK